MFRAVLVALTFVGTFAATLVAEKEMHTLLKAKKDTVAFYHVYADGEDYDKIVRNQVDTIKGGGLLEKLDSVYYATTGNAGKTYDISKDEKYVHIAHFGDKASELQTLNLLHQFCHANPSSKVLYLSDKGSELYNYANYKMCSLLNCYVLNPHCIEALNDHDTCGWRLTPIPYPHYPGNFWWARCDYVNKLIDPMAPLNNQTFIAAAKDLNECVGIEKHLFAEAWIGTGVTFRPADCMSASIDRSYLFGKRYPYAADPYCHAPDVPSGLPCQTAATFANLQDFKKLIHETNGRLSNEQCRDNRKEVVKRSQMMYGEDPQTYNQFMEDLYGRIKLKDGALIRFTDGQQVYQAKDNILHGVPNLKTFLTFGKDFDEVVVVHANEKGDYNIGDMMPSV